MQKKTEDLNLLAKSTGLKIHAGKSKVLKITPKSDTPIKLDGTPLEDVNTFTYLGSVIDSHGGTEADIKARIAKATTAFQQLKKIWRANKISLKTKIKLFNSNVKSVLLYGCETWKTTDTIIRKIQTFVNRCLRKILKIKWEDRVRNDEVWERSGQELMSTVLGQRKWRWIGHTLRKPQQSVTKQSLQWNPQGARKRGRPRETWKRCVERDERNGILLE